MLEDILGHQGEKVTELKLPFVVSIDDFGPFFELGFCRNLIE